MPLNNIMHVTPYPTLEDALRANPGAWPEAEALLVQPNMDEVAEGMLSDLQERGYPTKHLIVVASVQPKLPKSPDGRYRV